jgi:glycerophosphoryl diester phosphodiesterase
MSTLVNSVWHDFLRARRPLFIFEILFKLVEVWLLVPAGAFIFAMIMSASGHVAVSNNDIVSFVLTPMGLLYAALLTTVVVALLLVEQAGVMILAAETNSTQRPSVWQSFRAVLGPTLRIAQLGAIQALFLALALAPFAAFAWLTYRVLLTEFDIYFYWKERPPVFWLAAGIGGVLLLAALAVAAVFCVRWALALPILLFERRFGRSALRESRNRVRGAGWHVGVILLGWITGVVLIGVLLEAGFRLVASAVLNTAGDHPIVPTLLLLLAQSALVATISFILIVGLGLITRRVYLRRTEELAIVPVSGQPAVESVEQPRVAWSWRLALLSLPLFLLAPVVLFTNLSRYLVDRPMVKVTAHRGHARAAPENTLSSMRKAIECGADYAEMDVQLTGDGVVVLLHDRDLKRVSGDPRRLEDVPFDEVRRLDVGSWFAPAFAGERVPTLVEVIQLCRGKIRLNIEIKVFSPPQLLIQKVADIVREQNFESECLITSLDADTLRQVQQINPRLKTGLTVAQALGNIHRLEFDALSVRADFLTDDTLRAAHALGREVHVWTVNDPRQMFTVIKRGVDNIITSDPDEAIRVRKEWAGLTGPERLVLAARLLLGLNP